MSGFISGMRMKVHQDCFPCFLRQTLIALRLAGVPQGEIEGNETAHRVIDSVMEQIGKIDISKSPAHATTFMHRAIRDSLGLDPYSRIKDEYNRKAMDLYPELTARVKSNDDPLQTAIRLAIAGNIIDFGIFDSVDIEGTVERALNQPLEVDESAAMVRALSRRDDILYLLDNAGEIAFDRILIEVLAGMGKRVTAVVKGGPIINDCTIADAAAVGLDKVCDVIDNGSDGVGTILEFASPEFKERYARKGTLVISKGQGNFETLIGDEASEIFFLFQSKCEVVCRVLRLEHGAMLIAGSRAALDIQ